MMEYIDEESRRVLQVVDYAERTGSPLAMEEFSSFAEAPVRRSRPVGIAAIALMGASETESVLSFARRTRLINSEDGLVRLTRLGRIVLSGAAEQESTAGASQDIVLAAGDPWSAVDLLRAVQQAGKCLVVDPYCREPQIFDLARHTEATRVLIGPGAAKDDFSLILGSIRQPRVLEVRVSSEIHDRHVIPEGGAVLSLGASLNGIGQNKPTVLVHLTADWSASVRATYEESWRRATPWALPSQEDSP